MSHLGVAAIKWAALWTDGFVSYLMGFESLNSLFLVLLSQDDEGPTVFVECETHVIYLKSGEGKQVSD